MKRQATTWILGGAAMVLGTTLACASQSTKQSTSTPSATADAGSSTIESQSAGAAGILPLAPHGGLVKESQKLNMELVTEGTEIRLYPLSKMGSAVPAKAVHVTAALQTPTKKKSRLKLNPAGDHFIARLPQKGLERYELTVEAKAKGEKENFVFQVEPKK